MPKQGDIILVPIPFTDLSSAKRRPVIVVSRDNYQAATQDMVVVAMTSNLVAAPYSSRKSRILGIVGTRSGSLLAPVVAVRSSQLLRPA